MLKLIEPERCGELFHRKADRAEELYTALGAPGAQRFASAPLGYRMRAEFRLWHDGDDLYYVMFPPGRPDSPARVEGFPIASRRIQATMPALREQLLPCPTLRRKLFQVEFLSTLRGELLITLVYHRALDEDWRRAAARLEEQLDAAIIGRSRGQVEVLSRDYVEEELDTAAGTFRYRQYEGGFSQPNAGINRCMIDWSLEQTAGGQAVAAGLGTEVDKEVCNKFCEKENTDLLELYCGNGNFSLPLASRFRRVLATEVSRPGMKAALHNKTVNAVDNLALVRLSAREMGQALEGERSFYRLQQAGVDIGEYRFGALLVDPPRDGLDPDTARLVGRFDRVLYISCNPETQVRDLRQVADTHRVAALALFDQFPYTEHLECGTLLERR